MRKLISLVLPAMVAASMTIGGTGCTVKVQAKETEEVKRRPPPPPKEEPPPPPKKKPRIKLNLRALKKIGYELDLPSPVPFKTGSAELDDEGPISLRPGGGGSGVVGGDGAGGEGAGAGGGAPAPARARATA